VSDATLVTAVRHGREGMPALTPRLSDAEARDVAAYVRLFSPGFETYTSTCAACHGDHGVPTGDLDDDVPQPTVIFNQQYFAHHDADALRSTIWHMVDEHAPVMPHYGGVLSAAEARAIVEYLRQAP
jgi:mono/diheme cytochrome c family protein